VQAVGRRADAGAPRAAITVYSADEKEIGELIILSLYIPYVFLFCYFS
jgi:hypothetical protein